MTTKRPSPLVGANTGIMYRGAPYHVQTEDSGIDHPHVITHLFADGGRILATRKTSYAEHVGTSAYPDIVRQIIRAQHTEMLVALRGGSYDPLLGDASHPPHGIVDAGALAAGTARHAPGPAPAKPGPVPAPAPAPTAAPTAEARRAHRASLPGSEAAHDSLDEIIIANLALHLDD